MTTWVRMPADYDHDKSLQANRERDRGAVKCPTCGHAVDLGMGDVDCDNCGQLFNMVGQALRPESEWEEPYDDY
jgi:hypothetical protein